MSIDTFLVWSGAILWVAAGSVGIALTLAFISDWIVERIVVSIWTKREFLAFVWERMKARKARP